MSLLIASSDARSQARLAMPTGNGMGTGWVAGLVADTAYLGRGLALGFRDEKLGLGHSDFLAQGPLGPHLSGQIIGVAHTDGGRLETELEGAWLQSRTLPAGLQVRAGRFASQIGYLNEQHPHTDDFTERPLLYRAFLGNHWVDDGVRINWTAPTRTYFRLGAEVLRGRGLTPEVSSSNPGAIALSAKLGGDIGLSQSWQAGLSWVRNRRASAAGPAAESLEEGLHDEAGHSDEHGHAALYTGRNLWLVDLAWKWAPEGNNRNQQVRVVTEYARITQPTPFASGDGHHEAWTVGIVWRFAPEWEVGARTDRLKVAIAHDGGFDPGRLREHAVMVAWKPSHRQAFRLQYVTQRNAVAIEDAARRSVMLQYIVAFGAHGAHSY